VPGRRSHNICASTNVIESTVFYADYLHAFGLWNPILCFQSVTEFLHCSSIVKNQKGHTSKLQDLLPCYITTYSAALLVGTSMSGDVRTLFSSSVICNIKSSGRCSDTLNFQSFRVIRRDCADATAVAHGVVIYWIERPARARKTRVMIWMITFGT
jgi:hypothetical protein